LAHTIEPLGEISTLVDGHLAPRHCLTGISC
jgi:hypothetical protein